MGCTARRSSRARIPRMTAGKAGKAIFFSQVQGTIRQPTSCHGICVTRFRGRWERPTFKEASIEGCSFWRVLVRYLGGRLGKMSVVIKRAHLSSACKLAQGRTQALRKLSLGDVCFDPPHLLVPAKTSRAREVGTRAKRKGS